MRKIILAALLATPLFASATVTNLVVNGGFESNLQGNGTWHIYNNLTGWNGGNAGIELRNNVAGAAFEGKNFVELDTTANSYMWQNIATQAGTRYTLSFAYSPRPGVANDSNGIEVLWNGNVLGNFTAPGVNANTWNVQTFDVVGVANFTALKFRAIGRSDSYGGSLDAISVVTSNSNSTPVPEPETYAMMLAGLAGLGLLARRRRA